MTSEMANPRLPNLVYIGADKAGSTSISALLSDHPEVYVTPAKDTYYFTTEHHRGIRWYERQFSPQPEHRVVVEVCHDYLYDEDAPKRIHEELSSDVKLLACLRDPTDRAVSSWLHRRKHGYKGSFDDAVAAYPDILEHGDYGTHLSRWYDVFEPERILIVLFDDLVADTAGFAARLYDDLALSEHLVSSHALDPRLTAARPRSDLAAALVKRAAVVVRGFGGPKVVGRIKGSPTVQRLLYRPIEREPEVTDAVQVDLGRRFGAEVDLASRLTGIDLLERWSRYSPALGPDGQADAGASGVG